MYCHFENKKNNYEIIKSLGTNIVDAMDTLYIMGMDDEFQRGKEWISSNLNFSSKVNLLFLKLAKRSNVLFKLKTPTNVLYDKLNHYICLPFHLNVTHSATVNNRSFPIIA